MDYEIMLTALGNKKEELDDQKSKIESAIEESTSTLSSMGETPIASLYDKIQNSTENVKTAYGKTSEWFNNYTTELNELENSLANFTCNGVETPIEFKDDFIDIFGKKLMPTLKAGGDPNANTDLGNIGPTVLEGFKVVDGNIIDTSSPLGRGEKYNLSDEDLALLAYVAMREQGSVEGAKLELSLMANLYERNKSNYSSVKDYVLNSGWFALRSLSGYSYPGDDYFNAAKEVLNDGNRYLASNVVEHDCLSDLASVSTGSINDTSSYIPGETVIHNVYGAKYVFVGFAPNGGDPFGYVI